MVGARAVKEAVRLPSALLFDVFGTVVDWRTGVAREVGRVARRHGVRVDPAAFADAWRAEYRPAMDRVRTGAIPWHALDALHRSSLDRLLVRFKLRLAEQETRELNLAWHRLPPWPDSVKGLTRLRRRYTIAPLSNGNVALLLNLAKSGKLPWDAILSAELFHHYKPDSQVYKGAVGLLGLKARDVMLVAAHKDDLAAARRCGLQTAYVWRPLEHGAHGDTVDAPAQDIDRRATINARDFIDLARQLGA